MNATAISNNDIVYLHWPFPGKITDCLGFSIIRHEAGKNGGVALPAMVGFPSDTPAGSKFRDTNVWPVQKFSWKDLFAKRGGTYWYEIVPMLGTSKKLQPDQAHAMRTNNVTLDSKRGSCSVFFNRGIISTQAIARSLPKSKSGLPNSSKLQIAIQDPNNPIRKRLVGDLENGVLTLLDRAETEGGQCYCALYELSDKELIKHLKRLGPKVHIILSNAGEDTEEGNGDGDSTNHDARNELHSLKLDVDNRMFNKGHIGHNKFVVYVKGNVAKAVLCGSTNWTATGLCAQSNNSIIIESSDLADDFFKYWKRLKKDTEDANREPTDLQGKTLRDSDKKRNSSHELTDNSGKPSGNVHVWFSPNTTQKSVPRPKKKAGVAPKKTPSPPDLAEVFDLIQAAKQGVLFLAFIPGNPSIVTKLKEVYDAKRAKKELFYLRGAATSPDPASVFRVELYHRSATSDGSVRGVSNPPDAAKTNAKVASVAGIFATFAQWEAEIYKIGHAVIHDKLLVIDPFTDDSVVVTGSHNLGFKASYSNDENMIIIRKDRAVAESYAAHILDVYEHYRWRWRLQAPIRDAFQQLKKAHPKSNSADLWKQAVDKVGPTVIKKAWHNLTPKDTWQDFYVKNNDFLAAEDNFWSSFRGTGLSDRSRHR